ncbi:MAG: rhodanese-like domain-containing protein [Elusimicrobia bacterium]|nr:rhodanese-like domain-containing protein [Elusimicrobiota bacterium]
MSTLTHKYGLIGRNELKKRIDARETFHLWNVLTQEHFKPEANIPGSKWFPVDTITAKSAAEKAGKDDPIVVYCGGPQCPASKQAAETLTQLGYTRVLAYEGGLQDWSEAEQPLSRIL